MGLDPQSSFLILQMAAPSSITEFLRSPEAPSLLSRPLLVVGAGGIGCELLKCLILQGFNNLEIVF